MIDNKSNYRRSADMSDENDIPPYEEAPPEENWWDDRTTVDHD